MQPRTILLSDDINKLVGKQLLISWPGHQMMVNLTQPQQRVGRAKDNDIVIDAPVASRYHAMLEWDGTSYQIIDGQVTNGQHRPSANGVYVDGQRITQHKLANGDVIRIPGQNENFITLTYLDESAPRTHEMGRVPLHQEVYIGRSEQNTLTLRDPLISGTHAVISPTAGGHVLEDKGSSNGTFINGQRIQQAMLRQGDVIQVGSTQLRYTGMELVSVDLRREGIRLDAINIHKQVKVKNPKPNAPDFKILIENISLTIHPREFVAIVGGSGAGKSTLLDALNGFRPADGQVLINGDNLYQNFNAYRHTIGYVPQDDIIHRELTVAEALRYVARLRLPPDTAPEEIEKRIDAALLQMAMSDKKDLFIKELSGGQRKRVSIAVELIADPGLIFLDEPTSGLDPGLDKKMMFTLRQVANDGKTVILVTHATGNIIECTLVAFLAAGGRLAFFGPPRGALTFFGVQDFAEIYNLVEQEPDEWVKAFNASKFYNIFVRQRQNQGANNQQAQPAAAEAKESIVTKISNSARQMKILTQRYVTLLKRDRANLLFLLAQSPIIGVVLYLVIDSDLFNKAFSDVVPNDIANIQKILFMIACVATWFGIINSVREIVKELPIYRRERLVNLSIPAYVFSKLVVLLGLGIVQAFFLLLIVGIKTGFFAEGVLLPGLIEIFITTTLVTFTSACFGLFLSSVAGREDRVMSMIPLFLIPQIVFAGVVFTLEGLPELISLIIFSRWGIEALGATVNLLELNQAASFTGASQELPFAFASTASYLFQKWGILLFFALLSIISTILMLKRQDVN